MSGQSNHLLDINQYHGDVMFLVSRTQLRVSGNSTTDLKPVTITTREALPGVLGIQGEGLFLFRDLGRRVIYFRGLGEKA